jgi:hypothetical protein
MSCGRYGWVRRSAAAFEVADQMRRFPFLARLLSGADIMVSHRLMSTAVRQILPQLISGKRDRIDCREYLVPRLDTSTSPDRRLDIESVYGIWSIGDEEKEKIGVSKWLS